MTSCNCKQELPLTVLLFQRVGVKSDRVLFWGRAVLWFHCTQIHPELLQQSYCRFTLHLSYPEPGLHTRCKSSLMLLSIPVQGVFLFLDVNECSYAEFNACPEKNTCVNLEGYYRCNPQREQADVIPHQLSRRMEGKKCRSHLGKYWESFCRPLWSVADITCKTKISAACSAPSPAVGRRHHVSQLLAISDQNAVYLYHISLLFLLSYPQLSSVICQNL